MKIAVVGAGAMGSVYAGLLAEAGNEVWAIDTWEEHVDAINSGGLRVEGASGDRIVRLNATTDPAEAGVTDLVIIATKALNVEAAARSAAVLVGPDTLVLAIQNGLGSAERVAGILGDERVAVGVAGGFGASVRAPGHVHHNGWELVRFGERHGPSTARIDRAAGVWRDAGFRVEVDDDINRAIWEKLICNVTFSGVCVLLECRIGEVQASSAAWSVATSCAVEAYEEARTRCIALSYDDPVEYVRAFGARMPDAQPSTLLDYLAGKPCEIEVINGSIPRPVNQAVTSLVKAKEALRG